MENQICRTMLYNNVAEQCYYGNLLNSYLIDNKLNQNNN